MGDDGQPKLRELFADVLGVARVREDEPFYALGGDSLAAIRLMNRVRAEFGVELSARDLFDAPSPAALAAVLDRGSAAQAPAAPAGPDDDRAPLSFAQHGLWFQERLRGPAVEFTVSLALRLTGPLDRAALRAAVEDVVARHDALRTVRVESGGVPSQRAVDARTGMHVERVAADELDARLEALDAYTFDLSAEIPLRTWLLHVGPQDHLLLLLAHRSAVDEASLRILAQDLGTAYAARLRGTAPQWTQPAPGYREFSLRQRRSMQAALATPARVRRRAAALSGMPDELALPYDRPRPAALSHRGGEVRFHVGAEAHRGLAELARATRSTLFMVVQAALAVVLSKLGGGDDIPLGTLAAGRTDAALEGAVGLFENVLVLRTDVSEDPSFDDLVHRVRERNLDTYDDWDIPFELLVNEVNPPRSLSRHPLFQVLLSLRHGDRPIELTGLEVRPQTRRLTSVHHDLTFDFEQRRTEDGAPDGIELCLGYSSDLFDVETARGIGDRLLRVLTAVAGEPRRRLSAIDVLAPAERHRLLVEWNDTAFEVPAITLPDLLEAQVAQTPDLPAVQMGDTVLSYAELNARANQLARYLISRGVGPETVVALAMPRSVDVVVALWATLKAGGAYLPIDPGYPADRIDFMLRDARPVLTLTEPVDAGHLPASDITDAERSLSLCPQHPVYVIYTSGSTGVPKAVVMPGASLVSLLTWYRTTLTPGRMAQFSSLSFDTSAFEVLFATTSGGCLVVPPEEVRYDVDLFAWWLAEYDVHDMNLPNLVLDALCEATQRTGTRLPELRMIAQGGEALTLSPRLKAFFEPARRRLDNYYGPTETHLAIAHSFPSAVDDWPNEPLLGKPIGNMRGYVLDERLQPVPVGVPGELYLAGAQLSRGYLNRPSVTASRFVANPFDGPGSRMYRTGDLVRWRQDGHLVFLGRVDHQVKIRGFRIELGEIETVLRSHPAIAQAAVLAVEDRPGVKRLVAYVVSETGPVDTAELRAHAAESLPDYMVPWAFVQLDRMPLNPNRKLDRRALPRPERDRAGRAPRTAHEKAVCEIYADMLHVSCSSIDDDFFQLGGSSMTAVELVTRIGAELGVEPPARAVFERPTPAGLADFLASLRATGDSGEPDRARDVPPPAAPASTGSRPAPPSPEPRTERLRRLFAEILECETVFADGNFFALGGHSLLATRLLNRIKDEFGVELSLKSLFGDPTPEGVAQLLDNGRAARPALQARRNRSGT
ncbi:non-ribosomal peptide synthetase [Streptomyces sp. NPDC001680]